MSRVESLTVALGARSYEILVGEGLLAEAAARVAAVLPGRRLVVVTDETVARLHLPALSDALAAAGRDSPAIVLPSGEATKDFAHLQMLTERLLDAKVDRGSVLVAFGGGVIGDLAGLAAALTLRGLDFVQVPTTLLAQVDSSVGGKTGINTRQGKNLVGAFHQPRLVLADIGTLSTLPKRELLAGYAEVVKYGLIADPDFFAWLETEGPALIAGDSEARRHAVLTACAAKAAIVAEDEQERGRRALLNLGHTFGHALEAEVGYGGGLLHGEAVAIGTVLAFDLSVRLGLCPAEDAARVRHHLASVGLPTGLKTLPEGARNPDSLLRHMAHDKKVQDGRITFVLQRGIGQAFLAREVEPAAVRDLLTRAAAA
ncbi:MAG: 3-dehydroquinate synthase [Kiloniellales bacterium]|nr:3-dehydroquinate synthase [Kiloniellales bacterium]